jgi:hypothetical protein
MALTTAQLIDYIEPLLDSEIFVPCASAENSAEGQALFKTGMATVIAQAIKKYNDECFADASPSVIPTLT